MRTRITASELVEAQREASVWDALKPALRISAPRPADSVTAAEFAEKTGYSEVHARAILRRKEQSGELRAVDYLTPDHKRAKCYMRAK